MASWLNKSLDAIERMRGLDRVAQPLDAIWRRLLSPPPVRDAASGTWLGHPVHPAAVLLPFGSLLSATVLDTSSNPGLRPAARRLVATGVASAVPAVVAGWSDWLDTEGAERRVGLVHAVSNVVGIAAYSTSYLQRRRGESGRVWGLVGAATLGAGGWLGGHLAYAQGVGVDTTAFLGGPTEWTDVAASDDITQRLTRVDIDGNGLLLTRVGAEIVALVDRCTHRGGSLAEGERHDDVVTCPWHGSRFALADGTVCGGPATRPQPAYDVRVEAGRVLVRREEPRTLRTNTT